MRDLHPQDGDDRRRHCPTAPHTVTGHRREAWRARRERHLGGVQQTICRALRAAISPTDVAIFSHRPAGTSEAELPNMAATSRWA